MFGKDIAAEDTHGHGEAEVFRRFVERPLLGVLVEGLRYQEELGSRTAKAGPPRGGAA